VNKVIKIKKSHIDTLMRNMSSISNGKIPCKAVPNRLSILKRLASSVFLQHGLWGWSMKVGNLGVTSTHTRQDHHQWGTIPQPLSWLSRAGW